MRFGTRIHKYFGSNSMFDATFTHEDLKIPQSQLLCVARMIE